MLVIENGQFKDEYGRTRLLRGVNLGGSSKIPAVPDGATWRREDFFNHRQVSFAGRPFPLAEADEHFARLRRWGLTFIRFLVTWEAVEHAGPGLYDEAYLDYLCAMVQKAGEHGFELFIDPHQDVWSRFSGGDGAPGWTFEKVGLDITRFDATGAALTHQEHGDPLPPMIWPTNEQKLAAATMFTLFFGGDDFAPLTRIDGEPAQHYLQQHYIAAMQQVARRLKGMPHVVGFDTLNEPSSGFIGIRDVRRNHNILRLGASPTPYQGMLLGAGIPQEVDEWKLTGLGLRKAGTQLLNPAGERCWLPGFDCLWKQHGVWDLSAIGEPTCLRPDHFYRVNGRQVDFSQDYLRPFVNRYAEAMREIEPRALIFVENIPHQPLPRFGDGDAQNIVSAAHWYDGMVSVFKDFKPWLGYNVHTQRIVFSRALVSLSFARQVGSLHKSAYQNMNRAATLIGEFGIPFDMHEKSAFHNGDFLRQEMALERSLRAMDDNLASWTLWNYTSDNTNQRGDLWNDEDFSIFSRDQQSDPGDINSGGRALEVLLRPYASRVAGTPLKMVYNVKQRAFRFIFRHDPMVSAPTEFFIPGFAYPSGYRVQVSDGSYQIDLPGQRLLYAHSLERRVHWLLVLPD